MSQNSSVGNPAQPLVTKSVQREVFHVSGKGDPQGVEDWGIPY